MLRTISLVSFATVTSSSTTLDTATQQLLSARERYPGSADCHERVSRVQLATQQVRRAMADRFMVRAPGFPNLPRPVSNCAGVLFGTVCGQDVQNRRRTERRGRLE